MALKWNIFLPLLPVVKNNSLKNIDRYTEIINKLNLMGQGGYWVLLYAHSLTFCPLCTNKDHSKSKEL